MSWHVVDTTLEYTESGMREQEIFKRDIGLIESSDILLAEVTVPSIGVGYEICHAVHEGIPVICMHDRDADVSSMVLGNTYDKISIVEYSDVSELETIITGSIDSILSQ
ncbi:MAG: deoxyribonucleoside 5'-monophosphate N-glycosidase [Methanohalobium sp.]|uniref:deoxyribonucleoside 5'-monophosphate N-glycosidase n=1 Tax=Methanohalobium sp. TaxID=2837493 RepID=UPI00397D0BD8